MNKILIADDEPIIIRGLKKMLLSMKLDLEIVGEASDGKIAIEKLIELEPDIAILDVNMPHKTGLDILKAISIKELKTRVIFLSGYKEFIYVSEAIRYGAVDYLLKPVEETSLENAIQRALTVLQEQKQLELFKEEDIDIRKIFEHINSGSSYKNEILYDQFKETGLNLENQKLICVQFSIAVQSKKQLKQEAFGKRELLKFSVFNSIQEYMKINQCGFTIRKESQRCYQLFVLSCEKYEENLNFHIQAIINKIKEKFNLFLFIGVGDFISDVKDLPVAYKTARMATKFYYFIHENLIYSKNIHKDFTHSVEELDALYEEIIDQVLNNNFDIISSIKAFLNLLENIHYGNKNSVISRCVLFTANFFKDLSTYNLLEIDSQEQEDFAETLPKFDTYEELKTYFIQFYHELLIKLREKANNHEDADIIKLKNYIKLHYTEDINLIDLAKIACMNPYYVSAYFKKATGENYKTYLTNIRMKESLKLLLHTDLKVYEISNTVGYKNVRHFTDKFKQLYGVSPLDYKKTHQD